jgi:hypothetical protein
VIVRADSEYESLSQLMDAFATEPASVVVGAGGSVGSQDWMKGALLLRKAGAQPMDMRDVAFDGGGDAIAALPGGSIQVYSAEMAEMAPHIETGPMRILATMAAERFGPPTTPSSPRARRATTLSGPSCVASTWARTPPTRPTRPGSTRSRRPTGPRNGPPSSPSAGCCR